MSDHSNVLMPPRPAIIIRRDMSHLPRARAAIKRMRAACHSIGLSGPKCPVDMLVPDDSLLDAMPAEMLEQALVMCTWPAVDVRIGGTPGSIQEGEGRPGVRVLYFGTRADVIRTAMDTLERAAEAMEKRNDPENPSHK